MNKEERHDLILHLAGERGMIYLNLAVNETGASLPTIRRDFAELAKSGTVERIRGGIRIARKDGNVFFNLREVQQSKAKSDIAKCASRLLKDGDVIFIDGGTTTYHLCNHLPRIPLRIISNSIRLVTHLDNANVRHEDWEVYLTGGKMTHGSNMLTGPGTVHSLNFYHADWAFLSVGGITVDGLYNTSEAFVETERKMIERSDRAVILADQKKVGTRTMCRVCGINRIDRLITNKPEGRSLIEEDMLKAGIKIEHV